MRIILTQDEYWSLIDRIVKLALKVAAESKTVSERLCYAITMDVDGQVGFHKSTDPVGRVGLVVMQLIYRPGLMKPGELLAEYGPCWNSGDRDNIQRNLAERGVMFRGTNSPERRDSDHPRS